jgi:hypothetical protein
MYPTKELAHGKETREWLLKIDPTAEWQLQIAAFAHDIERAVPSIEGMTPPKPKRIADYDKYKENHAKRSAKIIKHILTTNNFNSKDVQLIADLIEKHEVGGSAEADLVRDADSIRWFGQGYVKYIENRGIEEAKEKGWWMYKRATQKTKDLIMTLEFNNEVKNHIQEKETSLS